MLLQKFNIELKIIIMGTVDSSHILSSNCGCSIASVCEMWIIVSATVSHWHWPSCIG